MAKSNSGPIESMDKLNALLNQIVPDGEILDNNPSAKIDEWIGTGWYLLNASFSGSLFGGLPNRRSVCFAGEESTGKTFLAMSLVRNAQKMGYFPIYCDSEGAIDVEFAKKLGIDTSKMRLQSINTIEEMNHMLAQIINVFEETIAKKKVPPKTMIVLDSLGNLTSEKEKTDSIEGSDKRDMTKQQGIRKLFRVNGSKLAKLGIPFVVNNHVYDSMSMFSGKEISGGGGLKYNVSMLYVLSKGNIDVKHDAGKMISKEGNKELKKKGLDDKVKVGITVYVSPKKGRFARPIPIQIHIPFFKSPNPYVGLEKFLSWEDVGVVRGKVLNEKEYSKLKPDEQAKCFEFDAKIENITKVDKEEIKEIVLEKRYAMPSDIVKTLVVKHAIGGELPMADLFTAKVFTDELLKELDEKVIKPTFSLPGVDSLDDLAALAEEFDLDDDDDDEEN